MHQEQLQQFFASKKVIIIKVRPNMKKTVLTRIEGDVCFLDVAAPPEDGKANTAIERYLSKLSGKKAVIKRGHTGKEKLVQFS